MKSKYLQCTFYLDVDEKVGYYFWHTHWIDYKRHIVRAGMPNKVQYCGSGKVFMNLALIFDMKFDKPNKFMQFSNDYDFRKVTPFTARLAK